MGFFKDLTEDVSQAASELLDNDKKEKEEADKAEGIDLGAMLDDMEESVPETVVEDKKPRALDETAIITAGMQVVGNIVSGGSIELLGSVTGNITISGKLNIVGTIEGDSKAAEIFCDGAKVTGEVNSLGSVKVGKDTVIIGNIFATSAVLAGAVKGDIDVKGPVILDASAIVMGNIKSKSLQINNGAVIEGICSQCYADVSPTSFFDDLSKKKKSVK